MAQDTTEKKGIKETTELLHWAFGVIKAFASSLGDGKITFLDLPNFVGVAAKSGTAFGGINEVVGEIGDLDDDEQEQLMALARSQFDLEDDACELLIEDSLNMALNNYRLGIRWAKFIKKD